MNERNEKDKKKKIILKDNRIYWYAAIGSVAVVIMAIAIATGVALSNPKQSGSTTPPQENEQPAPENPDVNVGDPDDSQNEPVVTVPEGFVMPVSNVAVSNEYGFYYNQTLNNYYEHEGIDFTAEVGEKVYAVEDGTIESVYTSDVLSGTEIIIDHGNGVKSLYRFVTASENLKAGMSVKKGDVIATVAEANGNEYKDGAHLHFEVLKGNKNVDPAEYLTLAEK